MEFQVPQFIETEAKIAGPLTFRQFLYLGGVGALLVFLYFVVGKKSLVAFIFIAVILAGGASAFAFLKIGGRPTLTVLLNFFDFSFKPKVYLWKKKAISPKIIRKAEVLKAERKTEETTPLKIAEKSQLKKLSALIETRSST